MHAATPFAFAAHATPIRAFSPAEDSRRFLLAMPAALIVFLRLRAVTLHFAAADRACRRVAPLLLPIHEF